jgi:hypothetical protein
MGKKAFLPIYKREDSPALPALQALDGYKCMYKCNYICNLLDAFPALQM